VIILCIFNI